MTDLPTVIDAAWENRADLGFATQGEVRDAVEQALDMLDRSFGVPASAPQVAERLADAGWLVVPVKSDDDHATAWEAVVVESGRARGSD